MLAQWLKKCADDSEVGQYVCLYVYVCTCLRGGHSSLSLSSQTANWMQANTKECPKCKSTIEKNGGCNHMVCRTPGCKVC